MTNRCFVCMNLVEDPKTADMFGFDRTLCPMCNKRWKRFTASEGIIQRENDLNIIFPNPGKRRKQ
jgi:hypothetical protein